MKNPTRKQLDQFVSDIKNYSDKVMEFVRSEIEAVPGKEEKRYSDAMFVALIHSAIMCAYLKGLSKECFLEGVARSANDLYESFKEGECNA